MEILIPTTFKDISAFFEQKAFVASTDNMSEQKKIVRAKRSLVLNRHMSLNNNDLPKLEIISSTEKESIIFHHPIKRIKTTHQFQFDSMNEPERIVNDSITQRSITFNNRMKTSESKLMTDTSLKKTTSKRWFIYLLLIVTMLYLSNLTNINKNVFQLNPFAYLQNSPSNLLPQQSKEPISLITENVISRYGQFVRNHFFSSLDLLLTFIGQMFFRIEKYEYKNDIIYVVTSTYEHMYDWVIHNIFRYK
jgi:hypothetical protein